MSRIIVFGWCAYHGEESDWGNWSDKVKAEVCQNGKNFAKCIIVAMAKKKMSVIKNLSIDPKELFDYFIKSKGVKEVIFFGPYYLNPTDKLKGINNDKKLIGKAASRKYEWDINEGLNKVLASMRNVDAMISVDLMTRVGEFDELLFIDSSGDVLYMLKKISSRKKIVHVYIYGDIFNQN